MALHFELVTPTKLVRTDDVYMVVVPGSRERIGAFLPVRLQGLRGSTFRAEAI